MPDKTILTKLRDTSAVTNLLGNVGAIRPGQLDEGDSLPGITVEMDTDSPLGTASGTDGRGTHFTVVDVRCIAETYHEARNLYPVVEDTLQGYTNISGTPAVSMTRIREVRYEPGPFVRGRDQHYEAFVLECFVQHN